MTSPFDVPKVVGGASQGGVLDKAKGTVGEERLDHLVESRGLVVRDGGV